MKAAFFFSKSLTRATEFRYIQLQLIFDLIEFTLIRNLAI